MLVEPMHGCARRSGTASAATSFAAILSQPPEGPCASSTAAVAAEATSAAEKAAVESKSILAGDAEQAVGVRALERMRMRSRVVASYILECIEGERGSDGSSAATATASGRIPVSTQRQNVTPRHRLE